MTTKHQTPEIKGEHGRGDNTHQIITGKVIIVPLHNPAKTSNLLLVLLILVGKYSS